MQNDITQAISRQVNILTGALTIATLLIGAGIAYLRLWQGGAITRAVTASQEKIELKIVEATKELQRDLARKDLVDAKFMEIERRLTKTEAWREAANLTSP